MFPRIKHAHRTAGFFKIRGVNLGHQDLEDFIFRHVEIGDFRAEAVNEGGNDILRLCIEVKKGVVILNGRVPGLVSKRLAGVLAWWVPGSRDVVNGIAVEPPGEDSPDEIEEAVRIALDKDPFVDESQVRVGVRHRTVRLTGAVRSREARDAAEWDAWYVFGVDDVVNELEVVP